MRNLNLITLGSERVKHRQQHSPSAKQRRTLFRTQNEALYVKQDYLESRFRQVKLCHTQLIHCQYLLSVAIEWTVLALTLTI